MNIAAVVDGVIGARFAWGGRGPDAYDCYGLVRAVYAARGVALPEQEALRAKQEIDAAVRCEVERWERLAAPEPWCVVAFAIHPRYVSHVGVVMEDSRRFLHVMENTRVSAERLDAPEWARRIRGFYRWAG